MAGDDVATQPVVRPQRLFEVHLADGIEPGGACQRFGRDVEAKGAGSRVDAGYGHAGAIERDAVTQADVTDVCGGAFDREVFAVG